MPKHRVQIPDRTFRSASQEAVEGEALPGGQWEEGMEDPSGLPQDHGEGSWQEGQEEAGYEADEADEADGANGEAEAGEAGVEESAGPERDAPASFLTHPSGRTLVVLGRLVLVVAAAQTLLMVLAGRHLTWDLARIAAAGLTPLGLLGLGVTLAALGHVIVRLGGLDGAAFETTRLARGARRGVRRLRRDVGRVQEALAMQMDRPPASGEELAKVLMALRKQDEKITALGRITSQQGKPLVELYNRVREIQQGTEGLQEKVLELSKSFAVTDEQLAARSREVQHAVEGLVGRIQHVLEELVGGKVQALAKAVEARGADTSGLDEILRRSDALQRTVAALEQRIASLPPAGREVAPPPQPAAAPPPAAHAAPQSSPGPAPAAATGGAGGQAAVTDVSGAIARLRRLRGK